MIVKKNFFLLSTKEFFRWSVKRKSIAPNFLLFYVFEIVNNSWSEHQPRLILATTNQETKICNVLMGKTFVPCHLNQKCSKNNNYIQRKAVGFFVTKCCQWYHNCKKLNKGVYTSYTLNQKVKMNLKPQYNFIFMKSFYQSKTLSHISIHSIYNEFIFLNGWINSL